MSIPIPARPTFAPSPPVRTTSSSFSSPLPQSASSSSTPSAAPPPPPSPSPFILSGDTNVEYATLPLPDHCIIRWRSFKPVQSSTGAPIPPPLPQAPPAQPDNDQPPPPQPQASTSSSRPSSSSTWTQAGVQAIETARRSLMTSARAHRPARPDGRPPFNLADSLLAIATPSNSPPSTDKPVDIQHPSPASIDGGNGVTEEVCAAELWVFAISSDELDHDDDDDQEEGQLQAGHGLFRALNGLHWENLQGRSSLVSLSGALGGRHQRARWVDPDKLKLIALPPSLLCASRVPRIIVRLLQPLGHLPISFRCFLQVRRAWWQPVSAQAARASPPGLSDLPPSGKGSHPRRDGSSRRRSDQARRRHRARSFAGFWPIGR